MIPFIYTALYIFIAFTTLIIGFNLRRKECGCRRAESARNRKICNAFMTLPLTSFETLNKLVPFMKPRFPNWENESLYLGCLSCWWLFINPH